MALTSSGSADTSSYPTPAVSVARMFYDRVAGTPNAEAFRYPTAAGWTSVTWAQAAETVRTMAAGLLALGIAPEQRVAIASDTRVEWLYADLAIMCAGAATTAVYPSTVGKDVAYVLADSGTRIAFAEDDTQVAKLRAQRDRLPDLIRVVTFDGQADGEWVLSLADLQALGAKHLVDDPTSVDGGIDELNSRLNRWETIKDFRILDHDLSVDAGELTPSIKVKRTAMETTYAALLDSMYDGQSRG